MPSIYYDLSELYFRSRTKIKYYGIARVVAEIAYEVSLQAPSVQFVVFDTGRRQFFRIKPLFGKSSTKGLVDLGLPARGIPIKSIDLRHHDFPLGRFFQHAAQFLANGANAARFPDIANYLEPVDLVDGVLFSAARPKYIGDMAHFLEETGSRVSLRAMLYDIFPLHEELLTPVSFRKAFVFDNTVIMNSADQVLPISYFTDADIREAVRVGLLPAPKSRAVVQLCHECRADGSVADIQLPDRPYFLGVGITMGRKNLDVVLNALLHLLDKGKTPPLFVVAGIERKRSRQALRRSVYARAEPYVQFVTAPNQANLIKLYENALATVMASRVEGWGLPLGESLWLGTPAISAPNSSLREVGRDLAVYFDPDNAAELAAIFERFMTDKPWSEALRNRVRAARPTLRRWSDVASDVLDAVSHCDTALTQPSAA